MSNSSLELVGPDELARLWGVPKSWIYEQTRSRALDPIPCTHLGKHRRFNLNDPELHAWLQRQNNSKQRNRNEPKRKEVV